MRTLALGVVALAAALAVSVEPARGCSCIPPDPWSFLKQADGAFVGRLVSRRETDQGQAVLLFNVERAVKGRIGKTVEVTTPSSGASCGIETSVGQRIGLFLQRESGHWLGTLCWQLAAEDLLAAAALPAPNGEGPAALYVGGRFGAARTLALDAKGRTLTYGLGPGNVRQLSACPGGTRVVELVERGSGHFVAIREQPALWLVREQRLPKRAYGVDTLRCLDARGERLALFSSGTDARGLLWHVTPRSVTTLWRGAAFYASLGKRVAFVQVLRRTGTGIVEVDLLTGAARSLGTVPVCGAYQLALNEAETRLAGDSHCEGRSQAQRIVVVDLAHRPISARKIPLPTECCGFARWFRDDQFAYFSGAQILVYTAALRLTARSFGWEGEHAALIHRTAYGLTFDGALVSAKLPAGQSRVVRRLPGRPHVIVSAHVD